MKGKAVGLAVVWVVAIVVAAGAVLLLAPRSEQPAPVPAPPAMTIVPGAVTEPPAPTTSSAESVVAGPGAVAATDPVSGPVVGPSPGGQPALVLAIAGTVRDAQGKPLAGARIKAPPSGRMGLPASTLQPEQETTSDADGAYRLEVPDDMVRVVRASLAGYATVGKILTNDNIWQRRAEGGGRREVQLDFVLEPEAVLTGVVVRADGSGVAGARLNALRRDKVVFASDFMRQEMNFNVAEAITGVAGEDGTFRLEGLRPGTWLVQAAAEGLVARHLEVAAPADGVRIELLETGATISGFVFRKETGTPVEGADVTLNPMGVEPGVPPALVSGAHGQVKVDASGEFRFDKLPAGRYMLFASREGLFPLNRQWDESLAVVVGPSDVVTGRAVYLYGGHIVRGRVFDEESREPLAGVRVGLQHWGGPQSDAAPSDVTDEQGNYYLQGIGNHPGQVVLKAEKEGYKLVSQTPHDAGVRVEFGRDELEATQDIDMIASLTVSGEVVDGSGHPVTKGRVRWATSGGAQAAPQDLDATGRFSIEVLPMSAGSVHVDNTSAGYTAASDFITVLDKPVTGVKVVIEAAGTIAGRVVDPDGRPVEGAEITGYHLAQIAPNTWLHLQTGRGAGGQDSQPGKAQSDAQGRFLLRDVAPRGVKLKATHAKFSDSEVVDVAVEPGGDKRDVELKLQQAHFLAGRVVDKEGKPLEGANIHAHGWNFHLPRPVRTDATGAFRLERLPAGFVNLSISHQLSSKSFQNEAVDREGVEYVLESVEQPNQPQRAPHVLLIGTVLDDRTGAPIERLRVRNAQEHSVPYRIEVDREVPGLFRVERIFRGMDLQLQITAPDYATLLTGRIETGGEEEILRQTFRMRRGGRVVGRAVNPAGEPIADVTVQLKGVFAEPWQEPQMPLAIATSDADGRFEFANVSAGANTLIMQPPAPMPRRVMKPEVREGETTDLGDIVLDEGVTVRVQVVELPGERPRANVPVRISLSQSGTELQSHTTDAAGNVVFANLPRETHTVTLSAQSLAYHIGQTEQQERSVRVAVGAATLRGTVLRGDQPVPAANVHLHMGNWNGMRVYTSGQIVSDAHGNFEVPHLPGGMWQANLNVQAPQYQHMTAQVEVAASGVTEHVFQLAGATLEGLVLDSAGAPVAEARVRYQRTGGANTGANPGNSTGQVTAGVDGRFLIDNMMAGTYLLQAEKEGRGRGVVEGHPVERGRANAPVTITLDRKPGGTIVSAAYDFASGDGIGAAWCRLWDKATGAEFRHLAIRGADGIMRVDDVPPGTYRVEVSAWGYSWAEHEVVVGMGTIRELVDVLYRAGGLSWTFVGPDGGPRSGIACRLTPDDPDSIETVRTGTSNQAGQFVARGLWPGRYTAEATLANGTVLTRHFTITASQMTTERTEVP
ncbi:MAG: carboxypeptidase regulatory-like domain-containing protein [Candidatus Sumerlaeia bacterium]|nr:carboxypeptidase regulatory-like domain-containing protein [Candidatus Sumerlaeia bacterium]